MIEQIDSNRRIANVSVSTDVSKLLSLKTTRFIAADNNLLKYKFADHLIHLNDWTFLMPWDLITKKGLYHAAPLVV
jgi:hypothetical protein